MGKLMVPLVDSKETSGAKTESAAGRSRSRNNLRHIGSRRHSGDGGGGDGGGEGDGCDGGGVSTRRK